MDKKSFFNNANLPQGSMSLEAEQFIDLTSDLTLKSLYNPNSLISFWVKARSEFSLVGRKALHILQALVLLLLLLLLLLTLLFHFGLRLDLNFHLCSCAVCNVIFV